MYYAVKAGNDQYKLKIPAPMRFSRFLSLSRFGASRILALSILFR
jgi:hypothetical protein